MRLYLLALATLNETEIEQTYFCLSYFHSLFFQINSSGGDVDRRRTVLRSGWLRVYIFVYSVSQRHYMCTSSLCLFRFSMLL